MVKVLDGEARVPGFESCTRQDCFSFIYMNTKEIEVIKDHRPISHGPFVRRRYIGPLTSRSFSSL